LIGPIPPGRGDHIADRQRILAISARDCERIDRAGGPETARFIGRPPRWVARGDRQRGGIRTIAVGR